MIRAVKVPYDVRIMLGTRRHTVLLNVVPDGATVTATAPYWSEGSRTQTWTLTSGTWHSQRVRFAGDPWPAPPAQTEVRVTDEVAMIEGGTSRGKPARLCVHATRAWCDAAGIDWR